MEQLFVHLDPLLNRGQWLMFSQDVMVGSALFVLIMLRTNWLLATLFWTAPLVDGVDAISRLRGAPLPGINAFWPDMIVFALICGLYAGISARFFSKFKLFEPIGQRLSLTTFVFVVIGVLMTPIALLANLVSGQGMTVWTIATTVLSMLFLFSLRNRRDDLPYATTNSIPKLLAFKNGDWRGLK